MNDTPDGPANLDGPDRNDFPATAQIAQAEQAALVKAMAELKAENADLRDRNLRLIAEMENFRRRAERDKSEGVKYAASEFGRDMISVADNLRRAIDAASKDAIENPAVKTLLEGVEATERELLKAFERHTITRFDALGEKFDPHIHEAVVKVDVPNVPADVIVQVLQAGYKIGERVLRPATVILAKGGGPAKPAEYARVVADEEGPAASTNGTRDHYSLQPAQEHDPDIVRDPSGAARRRDRPGEKRASTVTQPVTESGPIKKDDLMSAFGKRLENGS